MSHPQRPHLPIGYWLRKADELLTARIDEAQAVHGLSRTGWQVLNVLHELGSASRKQLAEPLQPFIDAEALEKVLGILERQGLIEQGAPTGTGYRLTEEGQGVHKNALALQTRVRQQAMVGISEPEYSATVRVLQRLVENLTADRSSA